MGHQRVEQEFMEFRQAYGHTLFAIDRDRKILLKKKKDSFLNIEQAAATEMATIQHRSRQKCASLVQKLKEQLSSDSTPEHEILKVAEYLHIKQNTYSQYENEKRQLPIDVLIALAKFYNTSTDYILGLTDEKRKYK